MAENVSGTSSKRRFDTKAMAATAMLIALMIVMMNTPLGTIRLPLIAITIAHIPVLIGVMTLGLAPGIVLGLAFGVTSLFTALLSPVSVTDPLFVNPLVSVLPRLLIPITAYGSYLGLNKLLKERRGGSVVATAISVAIGNLTNTFGVYAMLYFIYADRVLELTGKPALNFIIASVSTTTAIKCVVVVIITTPVVVALKKALRYSW